MKQFSIFTLFFNVLFLLLCSSVDAQIVGNIQTFLKPDNVYIQTRMESSDPAGWVYLKKTADTREGDVFSTHKYAMGLATDDAMTLLKAEADEQGYTHNEYRQYYKGIEVEGGQMFEHIKDCYVELLNGKIIEQLNLSVTPALTQQQALDAALAFVNADTYRWEVPELEQELKDDTGNPNATYYPTGQLMVAYPSIQNMLAIDYKLVWVFSISAEVPSSGQKVYVNAQTGAIFKEVNLRHGNGPAVTAYDGTQTIDTKWYGGLFHGHHHLEADDNGRRIETRDGKIFGHMEHDEDDVWEIDDVAVSSAHWATSEAWDFFKGTYNRNGYDNIYSKVKVIADYRAGFSSNNAYWFQDTRTIAVGQSAATMAAPMGLFGPIGTSMVSLDILGHEFTHGVINYESGLVYESESGALNESFADIFGFMTERSARGGTFTWTLCEDLGVVARDMITPSVVSLGHFAQPSVYLTDPLWLPVVGCNPATGFDACGIHINSGVQNRWFYLLSIAIGIDKAALISYRSLCHHLGSTSNYPAARAGAIAAATFLYGPCSNEVVQTTNAWAAVGVGPVYSGLCVSLNGAREICVDIAYPHDEIYYAVGLLGANFTWTYSSGIVAYTQGPNNSQLVVTSFGSPIPGFKTITATSSMGGSASIVVEKEECRGDDGHEFCAKSISFEGRDNKNSQVQADLPESTDVIVYPNPAKDRLRISSKIGKINKIFIYSTTGVLISEFNNLSENNTIFDVSNIKNGSYFLRIQLDNTVVTKRFVKVN